MDIAFFVPRCTTDNSHGLYVIALALRLAKKHRVEIYSGAFAPAVQQNVACHLLPVADRPAPMRLATLWTTAKVVTSMRKRFSIVHVQGADAAVGNVVTAHYCNAAYAAEPSGAHSWTRRLNVALGSRLEHYCFSKPSTKRIIAVSKGLQDQIVEHYRVDPTRVSVIHHGIDTVRFAPSSKVARRSAREGFGLRESDFVSLFVGGDYRRKGLPALLKAIGTLDGNAKLLAVGIEPDQPLRRLLQQDDLEHRVIFVGRTDDMLSCYAAADCFVLPTRYDTFSLATLEAMACGLPVIVSRAAGVSEILTDGIDSVILDRPEDCDALATQLARLAADESLRAGLGERARRMAERHSWDHVVAQTEAVYREAIAS